MKLNANIDRITEIVGDDHEMKKTLLQMFLDTLQRSINKLAHHINTPSPSQNEWNRIAHEVKGAALNLGFTDLGNYCHTLEGHSATREEKQETLKVFIQAGDSVRQILNSL